MLHSRLKTTQLLAQRLNQLERPPQVLVSASAIGIYGDRGDEPVTESSEQGEGFLAELCEQWEAAAGAVDKQIRLVNARIGVVVTPRGGALGKMLLPFQLGGGGPIGSGQQYISWIDIDDAIGAIYHALFDHRLRGPVNVVSPHPVTNGDFARTLGKVLSRPAFVPMPAFAARAMFGEMADECLLSGAKVLPDKLSKSNFPFRHPDIESSLRHVLGKQPT